MNKILFQLGADTKFGCSSVENDGDQKLSGKHFIFNLENRYKFLMHISAAPSSIWQQDSQNHKVFDAINTVLLTVVEANDSKNQRSVNYISKFFVKK